MVDNSSENLHPELKEKVDKSRRRIVQALVTGVAFAVPLMASFSKDGLKFQSAMAAGTKKKAKKKGPTKKKAAKKK
jgi:Na+/H+-dicarboxylate symporter